MEARLCCLVNVPRPGRTVKEQQACDFFSRQINCKKLACLTALKNISTLKRVYKNLLKLSLMQQFMLDAKWTSIVSSVEYGIVCVLSYLARNFERYLM